MYESPIEIMVKNVVDEMERERENTVLSMIKQECGITINAQELIKALAYDRQQYEKGWQDAHGHAHWADDIVDEKPVYRCSHCHEHFNSMTRYCPYCGSYMNLMRW